MILLLIPVLFFLVGAIVYLSFWFNVDKPIKVTSWHFKLMQLVWDIDKHTFTSLCKYAWSVFGTITFIPFIGILYSLIELILLTREKIVNTKQIRENKCNEKRAIRNRLIMNEIIQYLKSGEPIEKCEHLQLIKDLYVYEMANDTFSNWQKMSNNKQLYLNDFVNLLGSDRDLFEEQVAEYYTSTLRNKKDNTTTFSMSNVMPKIEILLKAVSILAIVLSIVYALVGLWYLIIYLKAIWFDEIDWMYTVVWWSKALIFIFATLIVTFSVEKLYKYTRCNWTLYNNSSFIKKILKPFKFIAALIVKAVVALYTLIKNLLSKSCPMTNFVE